jgi:hypothetical protein
MHLDVQVPFVAASWHSKDKQIAISWLWTRRWRIKFQNLILLVFHLQTQLYTASGENKSIKQARHLTSSNQEMTRISSNFEKQTSRCPGAVHSSVWTFWFQMNYHFLTLNEEMANQISKFDSSCFSSPDIAIHGVWRKQINQTRHFTSSNKEMAQISSNF